jgi:DNA-directed RNA polymerase subunit RPC12/RpoP
MYPNNQLKLYTYICPNCKQKTQTSHSPEESMENLNHITCQTCHLEYPEIYDNYELPLFQNHNPKTEPIGRIIHWEKIEDYLIFTVLIKDKKGDTQ